MADKFVVAEIDLKTLRALSDMAAKLQASGRMTAEQRRLVTHAMMAGDSRGNLWTIGTQTGKWYRQSGKEWIEGQPPQKLLLAVPENQFKRGQILIADLEAALGNLALKAKRCLKCGSELVADARFCPGCGSPVARPAPQPEAPDPKRNKCARCGRDLQVNQNYCAHCGTKFQQTG